MTDITEQNETDLTDLVYLLQLKSSPKRRTTLHFCDALALINLTVKMMSIRKACAPKLD